jgi:hypothetical protein
VTRVGVACARVAFPALLAFLVMTGAERVAGASPIRSKLAATAVVWDGRVFTTHALLARWLRSHGGTYEAWARQHPVLAAQATDSSSQKETSASTSDVQSTKPDRKHLMAIGGAVFVAIVLALVLLYQRRKYDFRGRLQRSQPVLATAKGRIRIKADALLRRPSVTPPTIALRGQIVVRATSAARAVASGVGPKQLAGAVSRARPGSWLRLVRDRHPEVAWYAAAFGFATVVGIGVPFLFR